MRNKSSLKTPTENGIFFCSHNQSEITSLIRHNQDLFDSYKFQIGDNNYKDFRKKVENDILDIIADKNKHVFSRPYISTGHQPYFYHPGIWIKGIFIDKLARANKGTALDFIIDSDCLMDIGCFVLTKKKSLQKEKVEFLKTETEQPIECCSPPTRLQFKNFCKKIHDYSLSFHYPPIKKHIESFILNGERALTNSKNLAEFFVKTRKGYEKGNVNHFDIMLSQIGSARSFLLFLLHIAEDVEKFFEIYNRQLRKYRISHKLRYNANPFPDLKKEDAKFEIPFWLIKNNTRKSVYVAHEKTSVTFFSESNVLFKYKKGDFVEAIRIIEEKNINLRPKAIPLTFFLRMFFTDMFIHGISGAKYDEVTDGIIEEYYKVQPPLYIAASLTLFPDLPLNNVKKADIDNLKAIIRNIKFKPEIFETKISDHRIYKRFRELMEQKKELLQQGNEAIDKKRHYQQIKTITEELSSYLDNFYLETINRLKTLEEKEQEDQVIRFREYPYFLYDVNKIKKVIP